jgi:hypothetical protein
VITARSVGTVAAAEVAAKGAQRARVQRQLARLVELAVAHDQHAGLEIDVVAVQGDRLADPHPGDGEQADQGLICRSAQRCAQGPGGRP